MLFIVCRTIGGVLTYIDDPYGGVLPGGDPYTWTKKKEEAERFPSQEKAEEAVRKCRQLPDRTYSIETVAV